MKYPFLYRFMMYFILVFASAVLYSVIINSKNYLHLISGIISVLLAGAFFFLGNVWYLSSIKLYDKYFEYSLFSKRTIVNYKDVVSIELEYDTRKYKDPLYEIRDIHDRTITITRKHPCFNDLVLSCSGARKNFDV